LNEGINLIRQNGPNPMDELQHIKHRYHKRTLTKGKLYSEKYKDYIHHQFYEREAVYTQIIYERFGKDLKGITLLEIGAGDGNNVSFFHKLGLDWSDIWLNELLDERIRVLKRKYPETNILPGNALDLQFRQKFNVIFQSTVFSSILDRGFRQDLAAKIIDFLKPGGLMMWYDFIYDNPFNRDVKGIPLKEIRKLFSDLTIHFRRVTLAPPLGRRLGKNVGWINNFFPILRTHVVAWGVKNRE